MAVFTANSRRKRVYEFPIPLTANSVTSYVFTATQKCQIRRVREIHSVVGGASATVQLAKCTVTPSTQVVQAPGSGTNMLTAAISLTNTINTVQTPALVTSGTTIILEPGDCISIVMAGTLTGLVSNLTLVIEDR